MKRFHLIFGLTVLVVFLLTGQYMDRFHYHLMYMSDGPRMLYRTRHIFILMAGLVHVGIGSYFTSRPTRIRRALQITGSILITIAPVIFTIAFFYEPHLEELHTPLSLAGTIMIAVGTLLHLFSGVGRGEANA
ncbi:MAG TPA: hypothetical protein VHQ94_04775 [Pyrinomonadaceae bacterium]|jgi:hypothetical protein|nr:hypothetical protein [Pyrinomonadaceae bacterium]